MASVREVQVTLGLSVDKNGVWVKGTAGIIVSVGKDDDIQACFKRAFELADESLGDKMDEYLKEDEDK